MQTVAAVASAPGWVTVGAFYLPITLSAVRLEAIGLVSAGGLTGTVRLYDPTTGTDAPVSGSDAQFTDTSSTRATSGVFSLTGHRHYLLQAQVVGAVGADKFGIVETAGLTT
jgi:hypothetical protein